MSSGYLLKDSSGRVAGYALVKEQRLLLCMNRREGIAVITAASEEGEHTFSVICDGQERAFEWKLGKMLRAAVEFKEELISRGIQELNPEGTDHQELQKKDSGNLKKKCKKRRVRGVCMNRITGGSPDRMNRWPPPACWPTAVYVKGRWTEDDV